MFCRLSYAGGPTDIRQHLDAKLTPRHIAPCRPHINWFHRHAEVLAAVQRRAEQAAATAETVSRKVITTSVGRTTSTSLSASASEAPSKSTFRISPDQVTEQWMKAIVKKGLAIDLVDDPDFRAAVLLTARAGTGYVDAQKGDTKLPRRKVMTNKVLPALDDKLNAAVAKKIDGLIQETGAMLISDGWTSVQQRPIINALLSTAAGAQLISSIDTSLKTKDKQFIADFICALIDAKGPRHIVAVCMDGACKGSFDLITDRHKHVFCFICPTHSIDNFLKNVCSDKPAIKVRSIEGDFVWGRNLFSRPIAHAWEVIKFITHHSKPLSLFREIAGDPKVWSDSEQPQPAFVDLKKHCETRFASQIIMLQRYQALRIVVEALVSNPTYRAWLAKQKPDVRMRGEIVRGIVHKESHWNGVALTVRVMTPALTLLRLTDGKAGATLGKVYSMFANLNQAFREEVGGIDKTTRTRMDALFLARWTYFHDPVFTGRPSPSHSPTYPRP